MRSRDGPNTRLPMAAHSASLAQAMMAAFAARWSRLVSSFSVRSLNTSAAIRATSASVLN